MSKYPAIPEPTREPVEIQNSLLAVKENIELLTAQRPSMDHASVTWGDLVRLGIVQMEDVPVLMRR